MSRITLLDGGMGQELIKRSPAEPTPLWSARVMLDYPELVKEVHLENIRAGARLITVNAYSATRDRLEPNGFGDRFEELQVRACELALQARDESGEEVTIAGCLPPLQWSYRPDLAGSSDQTAAIYAEIARLQAPHIDLILCETMSSADQGLGAVEGAVEGGGGKPVWVSWTILDTMLDGDSGRLRSGETLAEAVAALAGLPVAARLLNCSRPESLTAAMPALAALGGRFGGYANGFAGISGDYGPGSTVKALSGRTDLGPEAYADLAMGWVDQGATIVGGCCEVGPAHIAELARRLEAAGHEIIGGTNV
ncbi:MAG: homocysteine S-methyltransferase family protein [Thermohalobaculum sp.]